MAYQVLVHVIILTWPSKFLHPAVCVVWLAHVSLAHVTRSCIYVSWIGSLIYVMWLARLFDVTRWWMCHVTRSSIWCDSLMYVCMCNVNRWCIWCDSLIYVCMCVCVMWLGDVLMWLAHVCDSLMRDSLIYLMWLADVCVYDFFFCRVYVSCGSVMYLMWLAHVCDSLVTQWCVTRSSIWPHSFICVMWLVHTCDVTRWYVWCDSFLYVTWLVDVSLAHVFHGTRSYVSRDLLICVTWLIRMCHVTGCYMWQLPTSYHTTCHMFERDASHIRTKHVTHKKESCDTYQKECGEQMRDDVLCPKY